MKHHLLFTFYVYTLWLTGIVYNDFHHKVGHRFGTFKANYNGNSTTANAKIILPLRIAVAGFVTIGFFHTEDSSSETEKWSTMELSEYYLDRDKEREREIKYQSSNRSRRCGLIAPSLGAPTSPPSANRKNSPVSSQTVALTQYSLGVSQTVENALAQLFFYFSTMWQSKKLNIGLLNHLIRLQPVCQIQRNSHDCSKETQC